MLVVRSRARLVLSGLVCLLVAAGLSLVSAAPAQAVGPNIIGPVGGAIVPQIPTLSWERVGNAARYDVQVSASDTFGTKVVDINTANSQYTPVVQLAFGDLWWRVRVQGSGDAGWSTAQFTRAQLAAPTMLGPTGLLQQPDSPPLISWAPVPGATQYNLRVSTDPSFNDAGQTFTFNPVKTTSAINPNLSGPGIYYAQSRAVLNGGLTTEWATPISYTIVGLRAAERLSPAENGVVTDNVIDWAPVPGAATYDVWVDDDNNFSSPVVALSGVQGTRYSPTRTLDNDTYYWRVRPVDISGNARPWSEGDRGTFQRAWPAQPHLEYPANGATVGNPFYFQWSPSERTSTGQEDLALASSYTLQISTSSTFQTGVSSCNTQLTTFIPQTASPCWPAASGTYYWRVIGHDDLGAARPPTDAVSAEVRSFTYSPAVPQLVGPTGGQTVSIPTLNWNPVAGAARYRVAITGPDGFALQEDTASTSYTPQEVLQPGSYSWQVQTISQDNRLGTSFIFNTGSFSVMAMPAAVSATPDPTSSPAGRRFPTLTWAPVTGATRYEVWAKPVANVGYTLLGDEFAYPAGESLNGNYLDPGDYNWFVNAFSGSTMLSTGSVGTFTINPLEVTPDDEHFAALAGTLLPDDPENASADLDADDCLTQILSADNQSECDNVRNTPVLRWAAQPNVGSYRLYLARDKEMTNPVYASPFVTLTQPMWTPTEALPDSQAGTAYYYRVVPCSYLNCEALAHAEHAFDKLSRKVVLTPVQHSPTGSIGPVSCPTSPTTAPPNQQVCQDDVTLSWEDFRTTEKSPHQPGTGRPFDGDTPLQAPGRTEARSYTVQTATDSGFNEIIEQYIVDQTTFTSFATTYPEGPVYWRVRANDAAQNGLAWSDTGVFIKKSPAPLLESPDGTQPVRGDLFLQWQALPFAASYRIEVYRNHDTGASPANQAVVPATVPSRAVSLTGLLPQLPQMPNGDDPYVWRVRRIDAANRTGAWSDWGHFRVVEPAATQTAPAADASVEPSDALFTWQAAAGAESYRFERRLVGTTSLVDPITTRALSWAPQQAITAGSWEWRVTAIDAAGNNMTSSNWRPFTVVDTVAATTGTVISGSGRVGTPLTVTTPPSWNLGSVSTTYQWYRNTTAIGGETGLSYTVASADLTRNITVRATGTRPGYISGSSTSNAIVGISGNAAVAVTGVSVSGTGKVGTSLTSTPPTWDSDTVTTTYQWLRDGVNIGSATGTSYTVVAADVGKQLVIRATGTRTGYDPGTSLSDPVTGVLGDAAAASNEVSISGPSNKVGTTWTLTPPTWNTTGVTTTYQWFRDATAIPGATGSTYKLAEADIGLSVTVRATGSKSGYQPGTSTSNPVVPEPLDALITTSPPTVTGTAAARETLTVAPGGWPSGSTFTYQWFVNGLAVAKETRSTYVVRTRDAGLPVSVRVVASKTGFQSGTASSSELTVAKLATTTTTKLEKPIVSKRGRAVLLVGVDALDLGVPLGKVEVREGKKVLATVVVKTGSNGELKIRLKKLKPGKHKLVVYYLGSSATEASQAKKVKLMVTKK